MWSDLFSSIPNLFFIRFNWKDTINYKILGKRPCPNNSRKMWPNKLPDIYQNTYKKNVKSLLLFFLEKIYNFKRRKRINLKIITDIFECPSCKESLLKEGEYFRCKKCTIKIEQN